MTFTFADILTLATVLVTLYIAISNGRKTRAEARASEATAVETYAEAATKMAKQSNSFADDIEALGKRLDERDREIVDLKTKVAQGNYLLAEKFRRISDLERRLDERDTQIADFGQRINELTNAHAAKDARIADLERLTAVQETEIQSLRAEVDVLRFKRK
jgi:chromosome segregation ATPase